MKYLKTFENDQLNLSFNIWFDLIEISNKLYNKYWKYDSVEDIDMVKIKLENTIFVNIFKFNEIELWKWKHTDPELYINITNDGTNSTTISNVDDLELNDKIHDVLKDPNTIIKLEANKMGLL